MRTCAHKIYIFYKSAYIYHTNPVSQIAVTTLCKSVPRGSLDSYEEAIVTAIQVRLMDFLPQDLIFENNNISEEHQAKIPDPQAPK